MSGYLVCQAGARENRWEFRQVRLVRRKEMVTQQRRENIVGVDA